MYAYIFWRDCSQVHTARVALRPRVLECFALLKLRIFSEILKLYLFFPLTSSISMNFDYCKYCLKYCKWYYRGKLWIPQAIGNIAMVVSDFPHCQYNFTKFVQMASRSNIAMVVSDFPHCEYNFTKFVQRASRSKILLDTSGSSHAYDLGVKMLYGPDFAC